jgi:ABC-type glycerol-3-phosphate transport system permease component
MTTPRIRTSLVDENSISTILLDKYYDIHYTLNSFLFIVSLFLMVFSVVKAYKIKKYKLKSKMVKFYFIILFGSLTLTVLLLPLLSSLTNDNRVLRGEVILTILLLLYCIFYSVFISYIYKN